MNWDQIERQIKATFESKIVKWYEHNTKRIYLDIEPAHLKEIATFLFKELSARFIIASAVDTPRGVVEALYHFDFYQQPQVLTLRVIIPKANLQVESLAPVIKGTEWIEREMNELFGITFNGHPDMRHLLLPDDWPEGNYPLRRDQ